MDNNSDNNMSFRDDQLDIKGLMDKSNFNLALEQELFDLDALYNSSESNKSSDCKIKNNLSNINEQQENS
jgi:hypothetical protein